MIICLYEVDLLITGSKTSEIEKVKNKLKSEFEMTDLGELSFFLGMEFLKMKTEMVMHQQKYIVSVISRFMHDPRKTHLIAAKRILRYIKGTKEFSLLFPNGSKGEISELIGYSDSDWCGDITYIRSTSGYVFKFNEAAISWCTKKQPVTALSSCEAEYIAGTLATCQAV
ncbi:secreted RxLR effector protein 161-like [Cicer arietinum]|uniref:secreted RxLR effector protein 161-like n=1 Tax=Cicer arietinum TaxID=3827 RepID=UPI003CC58931